MQPAVWSPVVQPAVFKSTHATRSVESCCATTRMVSNRATHSVGSSHLTTRMVSNHATHSVGSSHATTRAYGV